MVLIFGQDHLHQRHVAVAPIRNGILLSRHPYRWKYRQFVLWKYFGFWYFWFGNAAKSESFWFGNVSKKRIFWFGNAYLLLVLFGFLKISCIFAPCF